MDTPDQDNLEDRVASALGVRATSTRRLSGGCVGDVRLVELEGGGRVVAKVDRTRADSLVVEGAMLRWLAENTSLPVPRVLHSAQDLLLMECARGDHRHCAASERHAGELLAELHELGAPAFGFPFDTRIGGLRQPNPSESSWSAFFRDHRLRYMAREAMLAGRLDARTFERVERLANRLDQWLDPSARPGLIHGDVWSGNVLAEHGRITAFLDPALCFADPELELAFITLFSTFGPEFFDAYSRRRPIRKGFFEVRRHVHNLYPLLVHVRLFGGGYVDDVRKTLAMFGA